MAEAEDTNPPISVRLGADYKANLDVATLATGMTRTQILQEAVAMWFDKYPHDPELQKWGGQRTQRLRHERRLANFRAGQQHLDGIRTQLLAADSLGDTDTVSELVGE